jgi:hypothetical protein
MVRDSKPLSCNTAYRSPARSTDAAESLAGAGSVHADTAANGHTQVLIGFSLVIRFHIDLGGLPVNLFADKRASRQRRFALAVEEVAA